MLKLLTPVKISLLLWVLSIAPLQGQVTDKKPADSTHIAPIDIFDVGVKVLRIKNYHRGGGDTGVKLQHPYFALLPGIGYAPQLGFSFDITSNVSFYTDKSPNANISKITIEPIYTFHHQFFVSVISDVWTEKNGFNLQGDWRYYSYPSQLYGLGGHTSITNSAGIDYSHIRFYQFVLKQLAPDLLVGPGYEFDHYWDVKTTDNTATGVALDYKKYANGNLPAISYSSGPAINLLYDTRRNGNNPHPGEYLNIVYRNNLSALGSTSNWQSLIVDARKYISLTDRSANVLAFWSYDWLTLSGKPPYLDLPSTGWDTYANLGRGYIQGRLRGSNLLYLESEYRFFLTRNGLLGAVVFANVQTVSNWPGNNFDAFYPATGAGIRIKANKFSDLNICLDYGVGIAGANGFFFNIGEVF